eukprot:TRINITY_DN3063_c0_g1_i2.p1 TRINITY_DN3063_c0_g1~~TRINITY_DN3063_c0_g1_i2.p1  ORF type:complete len:638 (+),score=187.04 TRINITY_DN3063_c0_g1_i2:82-1995(+)
MRAPLLCLLFCAAARADIFRSIMGPTGYLEGDNITRIRVNSWTSVRRLLPLPYYHLGPCEPTDHRQLEMSISEEIWGDDIRPSSYAVQMLRPTSCAILCGTTAQPLNSVRDWKDAIDRGYRGNLIFDNLPVVANASWRSNSQCEARGNDNLRGFPLGLSEDCSSDGMTYLYNHLRFTIQVNETLVDGVLKWSVMGFYVVPDSVNIPASACFNGTELKEPGPPFWNGGGILLNGSSSVDVLWTYSVKWEKVPITWATRWDAYLNRSLLNENAQVRWLVLIGSALSAVLLAAVAVVVLMRTLHKDFNRYNNPENEDEMQEEVGWKLVHGDVFRPPRSPQLFCITVGTGVQVLGMFLAALASALFGFLRPANRGYVMAALMVGFLFMTLVNGFVVGTLQSTFHIKEWKYVFVSALLLPGTIMGLWFVNVAALRHQGATTGVSYGTVFAIVFVWVVTSGLLAVSGARVAYFALPVIEPPVKVHRIARHIPAGRWFTSTPAAVLIGGAIPFLCAAHMLDVIFSSFWQGYVYSLFWFLASTVIITFLITGLATIIYVYQLLAFEDYRWWWGCMRIPAGVAVYWLLYTVYYYVTTMNLTSALGTFIYFQVAAVLAVMILLAFSVVAFGTAWWFVRTIYKGIKVD